MLSNLCCVEDNRHQIVNPVGGENITVASEDREHLGAIATARSRAPIILPPTLPQGDKPVTTGTNFRPEISATHTFKVNSPLGSV